MAFKVKVFLDGALQSEAFLMEGQEYIVGRSKAADIRLENKAGISRQHFKFFHDGNTWQIETLSQFGGLTINGDAFTEKTLTEDTTFTLGEFKFECLLDSETPDSLPQTNNPTEDSSLFEQTSEESSGELENTPEPSVQFDEPPEGFDFADGPEGLSSPNEDSPPPLNEPTTADASSNLEKTSVAQLGGTDAGHSPIKAFLKIQDNNGDINEIFRLDGDYWVVGRSPNCEIYLNNKNVSRRHISIESRGKKYVVTDLGSSNGTSLNGDMLIANNEAELRSGDKLQVKSLTFEFEMRNTEFDKQVESIDASKLPALAGSTPSSFYPQHPGAPYPHQGGMTSYQPVDMGGQKVVKIAPKGGVPKSIEELIAYVKANKLRAALIAIIPIILIQLFSGPPKGNIKQSSTATQITPEQEKQMAHQFQLAKNHLSNGKPQLCIDQIKSIHKIDPNYANSKETLSYCMQQKESIVLIQEQKQKEENRRKVEVEVRKYLDRCESRMAQMTVDQLNKCLQPAIALDPENARINQMMIEIETRKALQADLARQKQQRAARIQAGKAAYKKAKRSKKTRPIKESITLYQKFLNGGFPALTAEKSRARRDIASLRTQLNSKIKTLLASCESANSSEKYVEALSACKAVLKEDRSNKQAKNLIRRAKKNLENVVKSLYQDGVFEASVGNIEAAKAKWKKVMEVSYPRETYYERSKSKLLEVGATL